MNKRPFDGLGKVYGFTLRQLFRSKANLISFGILLLVAIIAPAAASLIMGPAEHTISFSSEVFTMEEFLGRAPEDMDARLAVQYVYSILVMIVCAFSCTYIVRAIIEEKASKLVETLMVSVSSRALILGKVLAVLTFIFFMVTAMIAAFTLSFCVTGFFVDTSSLSALLANMGMTGGALRIGPDLAAVTIISLLLAYGFFALIAALSGAGCSNMEDVESANMTAMMLVFIGYIAANVAVPLGAGQTFFALCPVVSAFTAPIYYAMGDIGLGTVLASWAIQAVCVLLIYKASAGLYDGLIMYSGKRLKLRQLLTFGRKAGGEAR